MKNSLSNYYFYLHKWCIPVKGIIRSSICDFQREKIDLIPNEMCDILLNYNGGKIETIFKEYQDLEGSYEVISEYFDFLINKEFVYMSLEKEDYITNTDMSDSYETPYHINSCIIDFNQQSNHPVEEIMDELNFLGCKSLQLRFYDEITIQDLKRIIDLTNHKVFRSVSIVMQFVSLAYLDELKLLLDKKYQRIMDITLHSAPKMESQMEKIGQKHFIFSENVINDCSACGKISSFYFDKSYYTYLIGQKHNTCLYKKIAIDTKGEIKNCPSLKDSMGNINRMSLGEAILNPTLKKIWHITKSQISVCKTCEFRMVCTDCRAYLKDENNLYSKPLKCTYNPETAIWE